MAWSKKIMKLTYRAHGEKEFEMEKIRVHISYLDNYVRRLSELTSELAEMRNKYDVTAERGQVERLNRQLEQLQAVLNTLPLA